MPSIAKALRYIRRPFLVAVSCDPPNYHNVLTILHFLAHSTPLQFADGAADASRGYVTYQTRTARN